MTVEIWFDLGSGGESSAIPLKITRPSLSASDYLN